MKNIITIVFVILSFNVIAKDEVKFIDTYKQERGLFKVLRIPMAFDSDSIMRKRIGAKIELVFQIDYVATSTNRSVNKAQKRLDKRRWNSMLAFTGINDTIPFVKNKFYQTKAQNEEDARKLFHGYIIYYRESALAMHKSSFMPMSNLMSQISGSIITKDSKYVSEPKVNFVDSVYVGTISKVKKKGLNKILEKKNYIVEWGFDSLSIDGNFYNSYYILSKVSAGLLLAYQSLKDKSLFEMLKRNKYGENTLIATDLTGSMYPYYSQLLVWHALKVSQKEKMNYTFFNDGDQKSQKEKIIGKTGGIYPVRTNKTYQLYQTMSKCMQGGGGGDGPENNFEAVIEGLKRFEGIDHIILICDNWAVPRDVRLLKSIGIPIDFVMCGTDFGVNPRYINLAQSNNGKIITMENSIDCLDDVEEGERIRIGGQFFIKGERGFERTK